MAAWSIYPTLLHHGLVDCMSSKEGQLVCNMVEQIKPVEYATVQPDT
jgi:hypothetical protein